MHLLLILFIIITLTTDDNKISTHDENGCEIKLTENRHVLRSVWKQCKLIQRAVLLDNITYN